jgi:molecular chaperone DnaK (HSP70)
MSPTMAAKYSIGIDLGTTNCAMSFVPLQNQEASSELFPIPQWESVDQLTESLTLPSFLYRPTEAEARLLQADGWLCGRFARRRAGETPGRVAHSAKSWLGHHAVDRSAPFLPWGSTELSQAEKISPIRASALLLNFLRGAWDARFAAEGPDSRFDAQEITLTVPASFDAVAQKLTLDAAAEAGFPQQVRLLEEPQAAFYRWLEAHSDPAALWDGLPATIGETRHVLVIDIGGGTSDFSLFEIAHQQAGETPAIRRVAVSEHLLLGGDNIDLALAHRMEPRFAGADETLAGSQWQDLVARCRDLKEGCLATEGPPEQEFTVTLPGRGSSLFAGKLTGKITRGEVMEVLLNGFYPECSADARPLETEAALRELGLPYAADSAVTRYLAAFLRDLPAIDAILFNGGSLYPQALRQRLQRQVAAWQDGHEPRVLENPEPDLAVARGAARFGAIVHHRSARIAAGAARSIYLEVHHGTQKGPPALVCILPRGAEPETPHQIHIDGLELRLNRPVRFQTYYSTRHDKHRAGSLTTHKPGDFHKLPPLQTTARLADPASAPESDRLPVELMTRLTELGLLQLECASADPRVQQSWPLAFNLRAGENQAGTVVVGESDPGVEPATLASAKERIVSLFSRHLDPAAPLTATRLLKQLEEILERPKAEWNLMLVRSLWTTLKRCIPCRVNSPDHEEAWLILAGYFLRPGFGAELDPIRIDDLWQALSAGPVHPGKRVKLQEYILWRRVAGGLDRARQQEILDRELPRLIEARNPPAELVRLAGSLERADPDTKVRVAHHFLAKALTLAESGGYAAPYYVSLGLLLNRAPLYAGPEAVVPPAHVEQAYQALKHQDFQASAELADLFLRAARVTDNRNLDLPKPLRKEIARKLDKAGLPPHKVMRVEDFVPLESSDRSSLFGESLPPGLILGSEAGRSGP